MELPVGAHRWQPQMLLFQAGHLCDAHNAHKEILTSKNGEMQYIKIRLLFCLVEVMD